MQRKTIRSPSFFFFKPEPHCDVPVPFSGSSSLMMAFWEGKEILDAEIFMGIKQDVDNALPFHFVKITRRKCTMRRSMVNTLIKCLGFATQRLIKTQTTVVKTIEYQVGKNCVSDKINFQRFVLNGKQDSCYKFSKSEGVHWEVEVWFQHPLSGNK